jgi:hypothetical protein
MASVAQIQANRLNAQKSTGPRTPAGKERASQNALRHGLLAREAVIAGEDPEEFELHREGMLEELAPAGAVEAMLAERVVGLSWRLRRAERLQNAAFAALDEGEPTPLLDARLEEWKQLKGSEWDQGLCGVVDEDAALGRVVVEDFGGARVLDRLLMYERRIESSLYRTMAELRREQEARTAAAGPEGVSRSEDGLAAGQEPATAAKLASFGADVAEGVAEEVSSLPGVSSLKCEVSSGEEASSTKCPVSGEGSDFTLQTSHFRLHTSNLRRQCLTASLQTRRRAGWPIIPIFHPSTIPAPFRIRRRRNRRAKRTQSREESPYPATCDCPDGARRAILRLVVYMLILWFGRSGGSERGEST